MNREPPPPNQPWASVGRPERSQLDSGMRSLHRPPVTAPTRQVVAAALALLVLGAVGAVQAGLAGASFMFDLEQVEPALARVRPEVLDPGTPRLARRVFL